MAQNHNAEYTEKPMTRAGRIQGPSRRYRRLRNPTFPSTEWTAKNPLLQRGEIGAESDTHRIKVGDGTTYWNDLPYTSDVIATWGAINGNIIDQTDLIQYITVSSSDILQTFDEKIFSPFHSTITSVSGSIYSKKLHKFNVI